MKREHMVRGEPLVSFTRQDGGGWATFSQGLAHFADEALVGDYCYLLGRRIGKGPRLLWIMLNPSMAGAQENDPTIQRCLGFTESWGYGSMEVVNLFAGIATDPRDLRKMLFPIGSLCDYHIHHAVANADAVCYAWGANCSMDPRRVKAVQGLIPKGMHRVVLGYTAEGHPKHPLRLSSTLKPIPVKGSAKQ